MAFVSDSINGCRNVRVMLCTMYGLVGRKLINTALGNYVITGNLPPKIKIRTDKNTEKPNYTITNKNVEYNKAACIEKVYACV